MSLCGCEGVIGSCHGETGGVNAKPSTTAGVDSSTSSSRVGLSSFTGLRPVLLEDKIDSCLPRGVIVGLRVCQTSTHSPGRERTDSQCVISSPIESIHSLCLPLRPGVGPRRRPPIKSLLPRRSKSQTVTSNTRSEDNSLTVRKSYRNSSSQTGFRLFLTTCVFRLPLELLFGKR